jgi:hypothetical protein
MLRPEDGYLTAIGVNTNNTVAQMMAISCWHRFISFSCTKQMD